MERIFDIFADQPRQHLSHIRHDGIQIEYPWFQHLHSTESQQLSRHRNGSISRLLYLLDAVSMSRYGVRSIQKQIAVTPNNRQEIVEVVRHTARPPACLPLPFCALGEVDSPSLSVLPEFFSGCRASSPMPPSLLLHHRPHRKFARSSADWFRIS